MKTKIGQVKINYDEQANVDNNNTFFIPQMQIKLSKYKTLMNQLLHIKSNTDQEGLKSNADLVMSAWFSKVNEIELADREKFQINSSVISCEKYSSGMIKRCVIDYYFEPVT